MNATRQNREPSPTRSVGGDVSRPPDERGRLTRRWRTPAVAILLVAPFFGEALSGSTPPLDLVQPWNLAFLAGLYGSGALICREVARRFQLGLLGLCLLGAAYGVYEEALVDRYWFYPKFWDEVEVGSYSEVWHTNLLLAAHLTAFHTGVSIVSSVLIVERLFPAYRDRAWAGRRGLAFAAIVMGVLVPLLYGEFSRGPGVVVFAAAVGLFVFLVVCAFVAPHIRGRPRPRPRRARPRLLGVIAFVCTAAHFMLVYSIPSTGIPWPVGLAVALAPIAAGILLVHRWGADGAHGPDGRRVVTGILTFFIFLDVFVGLFGRYDLILGALAMALALRWLGKRDQRVPA